MIYMFGATPRPTHSAPPTLGFFLLDWLHWDFHLHFHLHRLKVYSCVHLNVLGLIVFVQQLLRTAVLSISISHGLLDFCAALTHGKFWHTQIHRTLLERIDNCHHIHKSLFHMGFLLCTFGFVGPVGSFGPFGSVGPFGSFGFVGPLIPFSFFYKLALSSPMHFNNILFMLHNYSFAHALNAASAGS